MTNRRLRPTLPHRAGEVPTSFASRLAQLHLAGDASARFFCADMGIAFGELAHGLSHSVRALAELAGVEPDRLRVEAFQRVSGGYLFRDEIFPKGSLHRTMLRFCPACLIEDCDTADRSELAAYGRSIWLLGFLRTCRIHCMEIVEFGGQTSPSKAHDFAQQVKPLLGELERIAARAVQRPTSPLENYALDRLAGTVGNALWLDSLPLHAALAACDYIGMVQRFGRDVRPSELSGSERMEAGGCGFRIAEAGEAGIVEFMSELIRTYPYSRSATEGPQAVLGRWFKFLAYEAPHPAFDGIRHFVSDFLIERMPFGPGDSIFGKPVTRRVLHSVHTASQEMQVHPQRLRKVLHAAGVLTRQQLDLPNGNAIFDAAAASQTLRDAVDGLFMTEVESYLGAGRVRTKLLVDAGIVQPMFPKRPDLDHLFRRRDLDAFLDRLFIDALPIDELEQDVANIQTTAKRVCCGAMEIVRLVLERKLSWVGRHTGLPGLAALHVRISEVRSIVRGSMEGWLTVQSIEKTMHTSSIVIKKLIDHGHLKTEIINSPLNRCPVRVIKQSDFEEFQNFYVTLFQGMRQTGIHFLKLQNLLIRAGIEPSIRREDVGAAFYLRSDIISI